MAGPWDKFSSVENEASIKKPWEAFAEKNGTPLINRAANVGAAYTDARTLGLGPKVASAIGTLPAKAALEVRESVTGQQAPSIPDLYKSGVSMYSGLGKQAFQDDPALAIAASLAGGLKTGGQLSATKAGQAAADWAGRGGLAQQIVKSGALSAAGGAIYGAGSSEVGDELSGAAKSGAVGFGIGSAAPAIGATLRKLNTKTVVPTSDEVREAGSRLFNIADEKGGALNEAVANKFYNEVLRIRPQTLEGKVFSGESPVTKVYEKIPELMGRPMTLRAAKEIDEALGDMAYSTMDKFGKLSKDGKKFLDMQSALRRTIDTVDENMVIGGKEGFNALKDARKYWSTSLRMRDIERIIDNAQRMDQPASAIRTGFRTLLRNGDRLKGYTPEEVKALEKAAKTGIVTDLLRLAGSGLVPIGGGVTGLSGGPMGGAAGFAVGSAVQQGAKSVATARQLARASEAAKKVAEKSGMVEEVYRIPALQEILKMKPSEAMKLLNKGK